MARQSTVENLSAAGVPDVSKPAGAIVPRAAAASIAESHLPPVAAGIDLLAILVRAHVLRGDARAALHAAGRLSATLPARPDPVDLVVDAALDRGRTRVARLVLQQMGASLAGPHAAIIKARIARAEGDLPAARAILVVAIERAPAHAGLRVLLTEMMVAAGTASDARAVLTHLGQAPVNPVAPGQTGATGALDAGEAAGAVNGSDSGSDSAPAPAVQTSPAPTPRADLLASSGAGSSSAAASAPLAGSVGNPGSPRPAKLRTRNTRNS